MKVKVKYFGIIAERVGSSDAFVDLNEVGIINLRDFFEEKHPDIKELSYKIAVNHEINDIVEDVSSVSEIALLPPFAGG